MILFFFFKQKTAYEMRISDWSSDVCSSDLDLEEQHPAELADALRVAVDSGVLAHDVLDGLDRGREGQRGSGSGGFVEGGVDLEIGRASCRERVCQYV